MEPEKSVSLVTVPSLPSPVPHKLKQETKISQSKSSCESQIEPYPSVKTPKLNWSSLCEERFYCHICDESMSVKYETFRDHLKAHYTENTNLKWLHCEMCQENPTKTALKKKKEFAKKKRAGKKKVEAWNKHKHGANFISHLSLHFDEEFRKPYRCRVKVRQTDGELVQCSHGATTYANLERHLYDVHYREVDPEQKYKVSRKYGFPTNRPEKKNKKVGQQKEVDKKQKVGKSHNARKRLRTEAVVSEIRQKKRKITVQEPVKREDDSVAPQQYFSAIDDLILALKSEISSPGSITLLQSLFTESK